MALAIFINKTDNLELFRYFRNSSYKKIDSLINATGLTGENMLKENKNFFEEFENSTLKDEHLKN